MQSPLSPLGSKLHHVWRYCDLGWNVRDETKYDVDVVGLNWAPVGGSLISDFYEQFEIRLAHGRRQPDEAIDQNLLPKYPQSGLVGRSRPFSDNILEDPLSPQEVVHPRSLGYQVDPNDLFQSTSGTTLAPFPMNRGSGPLESYTWRDTRVRSTGAPNGAGIPLDVESGAPLFLEPDHGSVASAGEVPSIGLPLLVEYRCFPSDIAVGLNAFDISLAINSSALPAFRSYSTGGIDSNGQPVAVDPDLEESPNGGFNPASTPPGRPTRLAAENAFYIGQLDLAYRVSRATSAWFDTQSASVDYTHLRLGAFPIPATAVNAEVRGATGFSGTGGGESDASRMDAYGDLDTGSVSFLDDDSSWRSDVNEIDGARYIQVRLTFVNDLEEGGLRCWISYRSLSADNPPFPCPSPSPCPTPYP